MVSASGYEICILVTLYVTLGLNNTVEYIDSTARYAIIVQVKYRHETTNPKARVYGRIRRTLAAAGLSSLSMMSIVASDTPRHVHAGCTVTAPAEKDGLQTSFAIQDALKQSVDIYNMVEPQGLRRVGDHYQGSIHVDLKDPPSTRLTLDITARQPFPAMQEDVQNVMNITTRLEDAASHIPYAEQKAEISGEAWKFTGSYLTEKDTLNGEYAMYNVVSNAGFYACAFEAEYSMGDDTRPTIIEGTAGVLDSYGLVAQQIANTIVGQQVVFAGAQQHFNRGALEYDLPPVTDGISQGSHAGPVPTAIIHP